MRLRSPCRRRCPRPDRERPDVWRRSVPWRRRYSPTCGAARNRRRSHRCERGPIVGRRSRSPVDPEVGAWRVGPTIIVRISYRTASGGTTTVEAVPYLAALSALAGARARRLLLHAGREGVARQRAHGLPDDRDPEGRQGVPPGKEYQWVVGRSPSAMAILLGGRDRAAGGGHLPCSAPCCSAGAGYVGMTRRHDGQRPHRPRPPRTAPPRRCRSRSAAAR